MIHYVILLSLFVFYSSHISAQSKKLIGEREINLYQVVVKTKKGKIRGLFENATSENVVVLTDKRRELIAVNNIKKLNIKFDRKKNVIVFQNIAQTGLDIIADPQYTHTVNESGKDVYGSLLNVEEENVTIGERALVGSIVIGGALVGNELSKIFPQETIESFKINYSQEKYRSLYDNLYMYTADMQASPEYEQILKRRLKEAMQKHKPTL